MEIGIVIPLKAKSVSSNWDEVCRNVTRTVRSVLRQTDTGFQVAVVGHDCPESLANLTWNERPIFIQAGIETPQVDGLNNADRIRCFERDRCEKIRIGIETLRKQKPSATHWFPLDADDLVHRDFVWEIAQTEWHDAYIFTHGLLYYENIETLNYTRSFDEYCGSSAIVADHLVFSKKEPLAAQAKFIFLRDFSCSSDEIFTRSGHPGLDTRKSINRVC
jgi:hypothetical protein